MTADDRILWLHREIATLCVWREAQGESLKGKILVAQVIVNRAADVAKRWPRTLSGVVLQKLQFSSFNPDDPNSKKYPLPGDMSWAESCAAVDQVIGFPGKTTDANHYHTKAVAPVWADHSKIVAVEGGHVFYKL
jgi:spore germination cell wall hydrolase CwlJ-like protein